MIITIELPKSGSGHVRCTLMYSGEPEIHVTFYEDPVMMKDRDFMYDRLNTIQELLLMMFQIGSVYYRRVVDQNQKPQLHVGGTDVPN